MPMMATGAPMPAIRERVRKKHPMGTPALPTAEMTEMRSHNRMVPRVRGVPPFCITKSEVTRIKAAQPFMLMVVQMGSTNRAMSLRTPRRFSADSIVTGNVAALLFVKSAISTAGIILPRTWMGFKPRANKNNGRMTKN